MRDAGLSFRAGGIVGATLGLFAIWVSDKTNLGHYKGVLVVILAQAVGLGLAALARRREHK